MLGLWLAIGGFWLTLMVIAWIYVIWRRDQ
jgi:hypothetical protein